MGASFEPAAPKQDCRALAPYSCPPVPCGLQGPGARLRPWLLMQYCAVTLARLQGCRAAGHQGIRAAGLQGCRALAQLEAGGPGAVQAAWR